MMHTYGHWKVQSWQVSSRAAASVVPSVCNTGICLLGLDKQRRPS